MCLGSLRVSTPNMILICSAVLAQRSRLSNWLTARYGIIGRSRPLYARSVFYASTSRNNVDACYPLVEQSEKTKLMSSRLRRLFPVLQSHVSGEGDRNEDREKKGRGMQKRVKRKPRGDSWLELVEQTQLHHRCVSTRVQFQIIEYAATTQIVW